MEVVLDVSSLLVLPFRVLMLFLPSQRRTGRVMRSPWVAAFSAAPPAGPTQHHLLKVKE